MTCQQYKDSRDVNKLDNQFFQFVKGAKFKMCPRCKYWVEKNQGCNHMKCRCGADFCYLCGQFMDMSRRHICKKNY
jgi:ariadne-1